MVTSTAEMDGYQWYVKQNFLRNEVCCLFLRPNVMNPASLGFVWRVMCIASIRQRTDQLSRLYQISSQKYLSTITTVAQFPPSDVGRIWSYKTATCSHMQRFRKLPVKRIFMFSVFLNFCLLPMHGGRSNDPSVTMRFPTTTVWKVHT